MKTIFLICGAVNLAFYIYFGDLKYLVATSFALIYLKLINIEEKLK